MKSRPIHVYNAQADPGGGKSGPPSKMAMEFGPPLGGRKSNDSIVNLSKCRILGPRIDVGYGFGLELCADVIVSAAAHRSISVGGARRGRPKTFFLRFTKQFRSILKIFLGTFFVIKALRFVRPEKDDGSIDYGVSELQHENKY